MKKQTKNVLRHLKEHGSITALEAIMDLGCGRLGARIWELRHEYGWKIVTERKTVRKKDGTKASVACYRLVKEASND